MRCRLFIFGLGLMMAATLLTAAQPSPPHVPVSQWFEEPETHLPGWKVQTDGPILAFPQRWVVTLRAEANVHGAKLDGHDLYFFVKVADSKGNWIGERRYTSLQKPQNGTDLTVRERFYAKPGDYVAALVIYDSANRTHGIWKRPVHVPELDTPITYPESDRIQFIDPDDPFRPGSTPALPPLLNQRPMRVDVILNLTERSDLEVENRTPLLPQRGRRGGWGSFQVLPDWQMNMPRQEFVSETLLSIADAISVLKVNGCTRVSVVDAVRAKVLVDRRPALDPNTMLADMRERRATHKIDAHVLQLRQQAGTFLHNVLQTVLADNAGCGEPPFPSGRVIVLISDALVFPESKQLTPVSRPAAEPPTKLFFFRMTVREYFQRIAIGRASTTSTYPDDQVGRLLSDLDVKRFDLSDPKDFQKALPKFLDALKQ
jgi:hypothetical protein